MVIHYIVSGNKTKDNLIFSRSFSTEEAVQKLDIKGDAMKKRL